MRNEVGTGKKAGEGVLASQLSPWATGAQSSSGDRAEEGWVNFSYKGPDSEYFQLSGPNDLCYNYSILPL